MCITFEWVGIKGQFNNSVGNPVSFYSIYTLSKDIDRAAAVLECWATASKPYAKSLPKQLQKITDSFPAID